MRPARGIFSSKTTPDVTRPSNANINSARMGTLGEQVPAYVDSVMTPDTDAHANSNGSGGAFNEPLVLDFATMQDGYDSNRQKAPLTPVASSVDPERHEIWLSDDDAAAPAPQIDFGRRDIHVPSRTRYIPSLIQFKPLPFKGSSCIALSHLAPIKSGYHCNDD
jgi:hypothetical protein